MAKAGQDADVGASLFSVAMLNNTAFAGSGNEAYAGAEGGVQATLGGVADAVFEAIALDP